MLESVLVPLAIWREARGEGERGMIAVAFVIKNRAETWKKSPLRIVTDRLQFSGMTLKGDSQTVAWPIEGDPTWIQAQNAWKTAKFDLMADLTHGAIYYHNPKTSTSAWFEREVVHKLKRTAAVGKHVFYA